MIPKRGTKHERSDFRAEPYVASDGIRLESYLMREAMIATMLAYWLVP
jgi:hypothetical protein